MPKAVLQDVTLTVLQRFILKGKSLSLICGALRWLKDYQDRQRLELERLQAGEVPAGFVTSHCYCAGTSIKLDSHLGMKFINSDHL